MGSPRSIYSDRPTREVDHTALVEAMVAIGDELKRAAIARMEAALRQQGPVVNHKRLPRLMRERICSRGVVSGTSPRRTAGTMVRSSGTWRTI
jgi:hypothetical protein